MSAGEIGLDSRHLILLLPWTEMEEQRAGEGMARGGTEVAEPWEMARKRGAGCTLPRHPGICAAGETSGAAVDHDRFGGRWLTWKNIKSTPNCLGNLALKMIFQGYHATVII